MGGQIVIADWAETLPKEPNELRPAVVVEDEALFDPAYPSVILVPLTEDQRLAIPISRWRSIPRRKTAARSGAMLCRIVWPTTSARRVRQTSSRIAEDQLLAIRRQIALAIGLG